MTINFERNFNHFFYQVMYLLLNLFGLVDCFLISTALVCKRRFLEVRSGIEMGLRHLLLVLIWDYSFSMYVKFSKKLTFLTP